MQAGCHFPTSYLQAPSYVNPLHIFPLPRKCLPVGVTLPILHVYQLPRKAFYPLLIPLCEYKISMKFPSNSCAFGE